MFDNLSDRFESTFKNLTGRGVLTEKNIDEAMREIRLALLDADVNYQIVKDYIREVKEECMGEKVINGVNPGQMAKKVVHDHLVELMGEANAPLNLDKKPATFMMVGLHGAGKTTSSAKLALHLKKENRKPILVAADLHRPAAIDQLEALGKDIGVPVYAKRDTQDITLVAKEAHEAAKENKADVIIFDTAGRLQIDEDLVQQLVKARDILTPDEILLVADSALGQEAVSVATHFNDALNLTGIVLTKLDGDARGGAALSMRKVTGRPIKMIGVGEKMDDLQPFYPERMADRILGMGDVVSLVEKLQEDIDEKEAAKLEKKMLEARFDFEDFLKQIRQLKRLGGLSSILKFLPGGKNLMKGIDLADLDDSKLNRIEGIVHSMTPDERQNPDLLKQVSRRSRIARGCGQDQTEIEQLLKNFEMMRGMMSQYGKMAQGMDPSALGAMGGGGMPDMSSLAGMGGGFPGMGGGMPNMSGLSGFGNSGMPKKQISQKEKKAMRKKNKKKRKK
ncbi:MAG: signal recognition particle protein [Lentisphaeria bacterium]|nr:signal recognition particle protein [Lentisphaeria bacterium]